MKNQFYMSHKKYILLIIPFLLLFCCSKGERSKIMMVGERIVVNPKQADCFKYSDIFDSVDYITIPTDTNFIIGSIDKMIVTDSHILIMDKFITHSIFIFDKKGEKKVQLYKRGKGPGEYITLQDIFFDSVTQELAIYCNLSRKIVYYNLDGEFIREKQIAFYVGRITPLKNNYAVFCEYLHNKVMMKDREYPNLFLITNTDSVISSTSYFSNVDVSVVWSSMPDFSTVNDTTLAIKPDHCNTVYHITENDIKPRYYIDFGRYNLDERYWAKTEERESTVETVDEYCNDLGFCESYLFFEDSRFLYFKYKQNKKIRFVFHSLDTNKTINADRFINDMDQITLYNPKFIINKKIYCILNAEEIINAKDYLKQNKLLPNRVLDNIKEFDNPVIVVFSLKEF